MIPGFLSDLLEPDIEAAGEVGTPRTLDELRAAIQKAGAPPSIESSTEGSMAFIV